MLRWNQWERMKQFEHFSLLYKTRAMNGMRTGFFGIAVDVSSRATLVIEHLYFWSVMSSSNVDRIHPETFRPVRALCTAYGS